MRGVRHQSLNLPRFIQFYQICKGTYFISPGNMSSVTEYLIHSCGVSDGVPAVNWQSLKHKQKFLVKMIDLQIGPWTVKLWSSEVVCQPASAVCSSQHRQQLQLSHLPQDRQDGLWQFTLEMRIYLFVKQESHLRKLCTLQFLVHHEIFNLEGVRRYEIDTTGDWLPTVASLDYQYKLPRTAGTD